MSQPNTPAPNPPGSSRAMMRGIVRDWLVAGAIPGIQVVYGGQPSQQLYEAFEVGGRYGALVAIHIGDISESREAWTGPTDPGGKDAHYEVMLELKHRGFSVEDDDWEAAEDDHDRILDALKARLRAGGRDLGRPDVVCQAGDWPREGSIRSETDKPWWNDGVRDQWSRIFFTVSQYMQRQP